MTQSRLNHDNVYYNFMSVWPRLVCNLRTEACSIQYCKTLIISRRIRLKLCAVGPLSGWEARNNAIETTSSGVFNHSSCFANTVSRKISAPALPFLAELSLYWLV